MPRKRTHYNILKVSEQATIVDLRTAFRYQFLRLYPGVYPGNKKRAANYLKIIKGSFSVLADTEKRNDYDRWLADIRSDSSTPGLEMKGEWNSKTIASSSRKVPENRSSDFVTSDQEKAVNGGFAWKHLLVGLIIVASIYSGWDYLTDQDVVTRWFTSAEADINNEFSFENQCPHSVILAIRYWSLDNEWQMAGWWEVEPGESVYLEDEDGNRLISDNAIWYYYARTSNTGGAEWKGRNRFKFNGEFISMIELRDNEGDSNWSVSCDENLEPVEALSSPE
jgi:uncharacterized membrane protein